MDDIEVIRNIKSLIREQSCDRKIFDYFCDQYTFKLDDEKFYYNCLVKGKNSFSKWKEDLEKSTDYEKKHLYPSYLINVFFSEYKEWLKGLPDDLQDKMIKNFEKNLKNKTMMIKNLEILPGFNIYNRLVFELYSNPDKSVHHHDFNDLAYMRVAVPYCDMVIGEKYWCDRVKHYKFDTTYETLVSTELSAIKELNSKKL